MKTLEERKAESARIRTKYPDRVPILTQPLSTKTPALDKNKYLAPHDLTVGQFLYVIRKRLTLKPENAIFLFVQEGDNVTLLPQNDLLGTVYKEKKSEDGFLYIIYGEENMFGALNFIESCFSREKNVR